MSSHGNGGDVLGKLVDPEKSSSWAGAKAEPASPRDLIGNGARTMAKKWIDAATAVGLLYRLRDVRPTGVPLPAPEPLWPIAGVGCRVLFPDEAEAHALAGEGPAIVVYTLKEFPMPDFLKIMEWDGFPIRYIEAGGR